MVERLNDQQRYALAVLAHREMVTTAPITSWGSISRQIPATVDARTAHSLRRRGLCMLAWRHDVQLWRVKLTEKGNQAALAIDAETDA